ncbi:MAG TPA: NAD(P)-dependent glycerol-1-phosphate dehydrogenase [Candidatus Thermoplasmatota archaeon]|jgi:glycerol-1-phosphate dehydrogenase [NAD(P)+]|nr:NAD(P)-dependent glycerol-1-phosphate dehydrogenase [Candidatus Thermoplasmatota archaeon]
MDEFQKARQMVFPRSVLVGHGVLDQLGNVCKELELDGPGLVVTGPHTRAIAGDHAGKVLAGAGVKFEWVTVEGASEASVAQVQQAVKQARATFAVGVGGGSVIDATKLGSYRAKVPFLSVPTSASHDGITSPRASIRDARGSASIAAQAPLAILADTSIIVKAPFRMLASGCGDVLSNINALLDWGLAHRLRDEEFSTMAAALSQNAADTILDNAEDVRPGLEESAWVVTKALIVSGVSMSVAGSSRPASGAEHMVSHTLDKLAPGRALHGEQCGVATILALYLHGADWEHVRNALRAIGCPTTARELQIPRETLVESLMQAHRVRPDRYTILGDRGLSREAAERLVHVTGVA